MTAFWQGAAAVLLAVILALALGSHGKQTGILLSIGVCCMVGCIAVSYLSPVVDFLHRLQQIGELDGQMLRIMLKAVGIAMVGEIASMICTDSGNAALGKALQLLSAATILWLSLPLLEALLDMLQGILGGV